MSLLTIDTPLTRAALEIATKAHEGQTRSDGQPYITHPIAVANRAVELYQHEETEPIDNDWELLTVIGVLHDVLEDNPSYQLESIVAKLISLGLPLGAALHVDQALYSLNKHNHDSYLALALAAKDRYLARYVKRADLWHNLPTCKPNNRDKYLLAQYILEQP